MHGYNFGGATGPGMYGGAAMEVRDPRFQGPLSRDPRRAPRGRPNRGGVRPQRGRPQRGGLGQVAQALNKRVPPGGPPGRTLVPPSQRGYPGGGHPNLGGRNPLMRGANRRNPMRGGRGPTSYLR